MSPLFGSPVARLRACEKTRWNDGQPEACRRASRNIDVFVGRTVPIIGEVILAYDVSVISYCSAVHYNQLVKPEDRL